MKPALLLSFLLLISFSATSQVNLYVDSAVAANGTGTTWATAFKSLNSALIVANNAPTSIKYIINIAKGTYYPNGTATLYNPDSSFILYRSGVNILGGYPNGGGPRNAAANPTILSGKLPANGINHIMVIISLPTGADSVILDGLTYKDAYSAGTGTKLYNGVAVQKSLAAAIFVTAHCPLVISKCSFLSNASPVNRYIIYHEGGTIIADSCYFSENSGGIDNNYCSSQISNCTFFKNSGSCLLNENTQQHVLNSTFNNNHSAYSGCIVNNNASQLAVSGCTFNADTVIGTGSGTYLQGEGGGIAVYDGSAIISNCTFTNLTATGTAIGGAICNTVTQDSVSVTNCSFTNCTSEWDGGAIGNEGFIRVSNCNFTGNKATTGDGGAISSYYSLGATTAFVTSCNFTSNQSTEGGGIANHGYMAVERCVFSGNISGNGGGLSTNGGPVKNCKFLGNRGSYGGALYCSFGSSQVSNCLMTGNSGYNGGAMAFCDGSYQIINCTASGNKGLSQNGVYLQTNFAGTNYNVSLSINNCILWDGTTSLVSGSSTYGSISAANSIIATSGPSPYTGSGNTNSDPLFVSPLASTAAPTVNGDYHLMACSPAINTGSGSSVGTVDADSNARYVGVLDRGAYEFQTAVPILTPITGNSTLCANATLQLSNTTSGGVWTSSSPAVATVSTSGLVTGLSAGTDTIKYATINSLGCSGIVTRIITVYAVPNLAAISGPNTLCAGTTITLANSTSGGAWSSSDPGIATIGSTGIVSGIVGGVDTVKYTVVNTNGCAKTVAKTITINPLPALSVISAPDSLCTGLNYSVTNSYTGGAWFSNDTFVARINRTNGMLIAVGPGQATLTYTAATSAGCSASASRTITILATPVISPITGNSSVCAGSLIQLSESSPGGAWSSSNPAVATVNSSGLVNALTAGTATISYTISNSSGCVATQTKAITATTIDNTVTKNGTILTATQTGASYQWVACPGYLPIAAQTNRIFTATANGNYAVVISLNGCTDTSACETLTGLSVHATPLEKLLVYPNPSNGQISVTAAFVAENILVADITGRILIVTRPTGQKTVLNLNSYPSGIYVITITNPAGLRETRKVTISH